MAFLGAQPDDDSDDNEPDDEEEFEDWIDQVYGFMHHVNVHVRSESTTEDDIDAFIGVVATTSEEMTGIGEVSKVTQDVT